VLHGTLCSRPVISTPSSFAWLAEKTVRQQGPLQTVQIGKGLQGTIFEQIGNPRYDGSRYAIKQERPGNSALRTNLANEYAIHTAVHAAFDRYKPLVHNRVQVPAVYGYEDSDHSIREHLLEDSRASLRIGQATMKMERILPLPKIARKALVARYQPYRMDGDRIVNDTPNKHCLVRVYLGKRRPDYTRKGGFSLRNFPLYLDDMVLLLLDTDRMAIEMGQSFATMHWGAGVDGDDVEFVFGTDCIGREANVDHRPFIVQCRRIGLWLLDFGQCERVDLSADADVVYEAFWAAMVTGDNQSFIPNCKDNPQLWASFKHGHVEAGRLILKDKGLEKKFDLREFMAGYEEYAEDFLL
jgi:hypothetical protein